MSPTWELPITNRCEDDLKKPDGIGYLNAKDLNRIEGNTAYVAEKLNKFQYHVQIQGQPKTDWNTYDIPFTSDIWRICNNIKAIKRAFCIPVDISNLENKPLHFEDVNLMERILLLNKDAIDWMVTGFKKSGTLKAGNSTKLLFLPKRRTQ